MNFLSDPVTFIKTWLSIVLTGWGLSPGWIQFILFVIGAGFLTVGPMLFTVLLIWVERKIGGRFQDRLGPNRVGPWGIFQSIADMIKIFTKEYITPAGADKIPFNFAPILSVAAVLGVWAVIPFSPTAYGANINVGVLYLIAIGALGELGVILAGFGSNNKYALMGAFRAVAQLVSYEVPIVLSILVPVMFSGSMGMNDIASAQRIWYIVLAPVSALVYLIASIAENGRAPFDLLEADSELVAGFNIEYSGLKFGMFYVADFLHAFTSSLVFSTLFLGGWQGPGALQYPILGFVYLFIKTALVYFLLLGLRFSLPRLRIDQMMEFNWKFLTPLAIGSILITAVVDKLTPNGQDFIRIVMLLAANVLLYFTADRLVSLYIRVKKKERLVVSVPRPLAVPPEKPASESTEVSA